MSVILADLENYGVPFWDDFRDLGDMISWIKSDKGYQKLVGNLAIALALAGMREEAVAALDDYSAFTAQRPGPMHDQTRSFMSAFAAYFGFGAGPGAA